MVKNLFPRGNMVSPTEAKDKWRWIWGYSDLRCIQSKLRLKFTRKQIDSRVLSSEAGFDEICNDYFVFQRNGTTPNFPKKTKKNP